MLGADLVRVGACRYVAKHDPYLHPNKAIEILHEDVFA
jgi:hypothetical protein